MTGQHRAAALVAGAQTFYREQVTPRLLHFALGLPTTAGVRRRVCQGLSGDVVEIGFGSGLNVPHYPDAVTSVAAVEPSDVAWQLAQRRLAGSAAPVRRAGLDGQRLPFADDSFDSALSTWTLCSIPDAAAALRELRRVLKPGGHVHFLEHGLAPDGRVRRVQHLVVPCQKAVFGGCDLTKPINELVAGAGFEVVELEEFYQPFMPKVEGAFSLGVAVKHQ